METLWQDLRYGIRTLAKSPGFTAVAVLTLGLGIGANTAIFSVVQAVLLRPLPFPHAGRLVVVGPEWRGSVGDLTPGDFLDMRKQSHVFEEMAAARSATFNLFSEDRLEHLAGESVTPNFLGLLGVSPAQGRAFASSEIGSRVVILSDALARRHFGSDRAALGTTVTLNGEPYTVIGVMPHGFRFPEGAELWVPSRYAVPEHPLRLTQDPSQLRGAHYFETYARLRLGVALASAQAEVSALMKRFAEQYPGSDAVAGARVQPLQEYLVGSARPALLVLLGAVGMVLLIACANVANLLLARGAGRQREIAIRAALGASRGRLVQQMLTESVFLAVLGGGLGLLLALWCFSPLASLVPAEIRDAVRLEVNTPLLLFALGVSLFTGLAFGLLPALQTARENLNDALRVASRSSSTGPARHRVTSVLVVSEISVSLVLLVGAGLLVKSFLRLRQTEAGFDPRHVLAMSVSLAQAGYEAGAKRAQFVSEILRNIEALPGARSAAIISRLPLNPGGSSRGIVIEGRTYSPSSPAEKIVPDYSVVSPGYFRTLGIPLLSGRNFAPQDDATAPKVVMINLALARTFWPGQDPVGKRIKAGDDDWREIVGVVGDVRQHSLERAPFPMLYVPYPQDPWTFFSLAVKTATDPAGLAVGVEDAIHRVDRTLPVYAVRDMDGAMSSSVSPRRFLMTLLGGFAGLALLLAVIGIYGVMSYSVSQRTHEIGIRMALGAEPADVLLRVLGEGVRLACAGAVVGAIAALGLAHVMKSLLFGVTPTDPAAFAAGVALLIGVALAACYLPAWRAARVDPIVALRYE